MEKRSLPLHFYCRSARLLLKKAAFARKCNLFADELRHLKKFRGLASSVIPSHPEYEQENGRKLAEDLEACMDDVRERIEELEEQLSSASSAATGRERIVDADAVHVGVDEDEKPKRQYMWASFARKLKEAAPCFSGKVHPVVYQPKLVPVRGMGWYLGHSGSESVVGNGSVIVQQASNEQRVGEQEIVEEDRAGWPQCSKRLALRSRGLCPGLVDCNDNHVAEPNCLSTVNNVQTLQALMMELRDSVEGLKSRVEEEGKRWRARAEVVERKLKVLKDETKHEFNRLRNQFQCESKKAVAEASKEFSGKHQKNFGNQLVEPACVDFRNQVNQLAAEVQSLLMHEVEKKLSDFICDLRGELKDELKVLAMSKDADSSRQGMFSRFESLVKLARTEKQLKLSRLEQKRTPSFDVNKQLKALRTDFRALSKEVNTLGVEHKSDNDQLQNRLQKQLQGCKDEVMQGRVDMEIMMKNFELDIKEAKHEMIELKGRHQALQADIQQLKEQPIFGRDTQRSSEVRSGLEASDDLLLMEQLQQFSKLYTGRLTDLQERVSRLEVGQESVSSIQNSLERDENSMALMATERVSSATAASEAAALKARQVLEETLGSLLKLHRSEAGSRKSQKQRPPKFSVRRIYRDAVSKLAAIRQKAGAKRISMMQATRKEAIGGRFYAGMESKMKAAVAILSMLNARIQRLEDVQVHQCQCLEQVQAGSHRFEERLVRYEGTAKLMAGVTSLESKEHTRPVEESTDMLGEAAVLQSQDSSFSLQERLVFLERRVEHIASVTYTNFRLLGAKMDHVSVGMRSALETASETEDKCSSLGAELVRVFRLLLSFRESSRKQHGEVKKSEAVACPERSLKSETSEHHPVKQINLRFGEKGTITSKVSI